SSSTHRGATMRNTALVVIVAGLSGSLLGLAGCKPKSDSAITGAGLSKEEALARLRVANHLQQLAFGLQSFGDQNHDLLPPVDGSGIEKQSAKPGEPRLLAGLSWRAHVLELMTSDLNEPGQEMAIYSRLREGTFKLAPGTAQADRWNIPDL